MQRTFSDLQHWTQKMFEKLGWMILSTHEQNIDKVTHYLNSIKHLMKKLDEKIQVTQEQDRINDLQILKQQVSYLQYFANASLTNKDNFKF